MARIAKYFSLVIFLSSQIWQADAHQLSCSDARLNAVVPQMGCRSRKKLGPVRVLQLAILDREMASAPSILKLSRAVCSMEIIPQIPSHGNPQQKQKGCNRGFWAILIPAQVYATAHPGFGNTDTRKGRIPCEMRPLRSHCHVTAAR